MNRSTNAARLERAQERRDAGSMEERFPEVASIVLTMDYRHRGLTSILRSFSYDPASFAYFRVSCLWKECDDGGFDLTRVITSMIRNHPATAAVEAEAPAGPADDGDFEEDEPEASREDARGEGEG